MAWHKVMISSLRFKALKPLISSTCLLTVALLVLVDLTLLKFRPLQYISDLRFIPLDQHPIVSKLPVYMESRDKVNVLVLGSSLPMCAIAEYDEKLYGAPHCSDATQLRRYLGAKFLEQQLSSKLNRPIRAVNLSIMACMASDMYIILEKSLAAGKKPDSAVLCIAPRDFVDNLIQPIGRTPPFEVLHDWKSLAGVLRNDIPMAEARDLLISAVWYYYRVKVDYRTVLTQYFSNLLNHPATLYYATHLPSELASEKPSKAPLRGTNVLRKEQTSAVMNGLQTGGGDRYRPPNFKRFSLEIEYFRRLLALCKKEKIDCVVVNMPMSVSHRSILDKKLDREYLDETQKACVANGARYFDFNDHDFSDADFTDGFHVNSTGAEKVMKRMIMTLACP